MKDVALLVGNGINSVSNGIPWEDLLDRIIAFTGDETLVKDKNKPFPLFYEEIFLTALRSGKIKTELKLKQYIAAQVSNITVSQVQQMIWDLAPGHVMTVNYEFLLEGTADCVNAGVVKETLYSVFRKFLVNGTTYWHLHGDCNHAGSINLGYEHYSGQLQQMRNYVTSNSKYKSELVPKLPLFRRLKAKGGLKVINSWIDLFFTKDIYIVGMTMDFVEMDLWWLLTYRTRQLNYKKSFPINNRIFYYIHKQYADNCVFKLDLLRVNGVEVIVLDLPHDVSYYRAVFDQIGGKRQL